MAFEMIGHLVRKVQIVDAMTGKDACDFAALPNPQGLSVVAEKPE